MIRVHRTRRHFILFRLFTPSFLLILVNALALDGRITHAEPSIEPILSHEKSLLAPAIVTDICPLVITTLTCAIIPATATPAQAGSGYGGILDKNGYILAIIRGLKSCDIMTTVDRHQIGNLGDFSPSLRRPGNQPTRQLTIQRGSSQSRILHQNPLPPKAVS
jgi:hypothetical protein